MCYLRLSVPLVASRQREPNKWSFHIFSFEIEQGTFKFSVPPETELIHVLHKRHYMLIKAIFWILVQERCKRICAYFIPIYKEDIYEKKRGNQECQY